MRRTRRRSAIAAANILGNKQDHPKQPTACFERRDAKTKQNRRQHTHHEACCRIIMGQLTVPIRMHSPISEERHSPAPHLLCPKCAAADRNASGATSRSLKRDNETRQLVVQRWLSRTGHEQLPTCSRGRGHRERGHGSEESACEPAERCPHLRARDARRAAGDDEEEARDEEGDAESDDGRV